MADYKKNIDSEAEKPVEYPQEKKSESVKVTSQAPERELDALLARDKELDMEFFLETIRRYTNATTITRRMVGELINHIDVYYTEKRDGVTNQRAVIHYNRIGVFDVPDHRSRAGAR